MIHPLTVPSGSWADLNIALDYLSGLQVSDWPGNLADSHISYQTRSANLVWAGPASGNPAAPTFRALVTADLPDNGVTNAKLRDAAALSVIGRSANTVGDPADITTPSGSNAVLRENGGALGFGTIATAGLADNSVTDAKLRQSTGTAVVGRSANSVGNVADIVATADSQFLSRQSGALSFQAIVSADLPANGVTDAKLRQGAATSVIGRSANSLGNVADIAASASGDVLWRSGSTLGFGALTTLGTVATYAGITTAGQGLTVVAGSSSLTGQNTNLGATALVTGSASTAGMYRVSVYGVVTTAGTGSLSIVVRWNDGTAAQFVSPASLTSTGVGNYGAGAVTLRSAASQNITIETSGTAGGLVYSLYATAERMS